MSSQMPLWFMNHPSMIQKIKDIIDSKAGKLAENNIERWSTKVETNHVHERNDYLKASTNAKNFTAQSTFSALPALIKK
jgi:hypothetical protein